MTGATRGRVTPSELLRAVAQHYTDGTLKHRQGAFGWGLLTKDKPQEGKPWPTAHEVYPWAGDALHRLDAASPVGAMCYVMRATPDDVTVQAATAACTKVLREQGCRWSLEVWADAPGRDISEVVQLLHAAAA